MQQNSSSSPLRLGSRGSKLARAQAELVKTALAPYADCSIETIRTTGDRIQDRPLADIGGKGLFTKELEQALLARQIDLAVHSMKDVPVLLPEGLAIVAVTAREDPRDAFISHVAPTLEQLPQGARIGTSSVRRAAQIARMRPDLAIVALRGNVDTRLAKLDSGALDAIMLALAGLKRLKLAARATSILATDHWLPALAQGAVGIEIRSGDKTAESAVAELNDDAASIALACERAFQFALDGSCRTPIAGLATYADGKLAFRGEVLAPDGSGFAATDFEESLAGDLHEAAARAGRSAGLALKPRALRWLSG